MITAYTIQEARDAIKEARRGGKTIGFVPTMGALHDGHLCLVAALKQKTGFTAMSIFVNRIQFNDPRDYEKYPRDYSKDLALAEKAGVDMVFLPDDECMYDNQRTFVETSQLDAYLCGAARPGHFRGVCTVVTKLFNIIQPDIAVFGQKDIQQARILEKMVYDLNMPISIIVAPIIRETDGLAMSSRNMHLSADERSRACCLSKALLRAKECIMQGERSAEKIIAAAETEIKKGSPDRIDYITIADWETLAPAETLSRKNVLALAAFFGETRLIDNMIIESGETVQCSI